VTFCGVTRTISRSTSPRLAWRALPAVLLPERAEQRLVPVLDQLGRAADVGGLVRVLGVEDCEADPWVAGEIPGLLAPRRGREEHEVTVPHDPDHRGLRPAVWIQRRDGGDVPPIQQSARLLVKRHRHGLTVLFSNLSSLLARNGCEG
jgi:hypothetical protein